MPHSTKETRRPAPNDGSSGPVRIVPGRYKTHASVLFPFKVDAKIAFGSRAADELIAVSAAAAAVAVAREHRHDGDRSGQTYHGRIVSIKDGLVHISELADFGVNQHGKCRENWRDDGGGEVRGNYRSEGGRGRERRRDEPRPVSDQAQARPQSKSEDYESS
ncbi:MAG TPA: hypothetical protein VNW28_05125 [Chthoniobacterales bacterium]|nr:hypothetical protein [Chthoniobacterales bacterium]